MTRARTELVLALVVALALIVGLAWYQGLYARRAEDLRASQPVVATEVAPILDTTLLAGPLNGTIHEAPMPEVAPTDVEQDREYIAEAFPVLSTWSVDEVKPLLSTAALNASTDAELAQVMGTLESRLGELQYFDAPQPAGAPEQGDGASTSNTLQPYRFTAWYEAGAAEVNLVLEKQQQRNALYSFAIHIPN